MTIYSENGVPILFQLPGQMLGLSEKAWKAVEAAHAAAQEVAGDPEALAEHLLIGEAVVIHNKDASKGDFTVTSIGASDLREALQEAIGGFDLAHIGERDVSSDAQLTPDWVASTHEELARLLADYYSCEVRDLSEVV
ncbi:MAG: hypothetical protein ACJ762_11320 [Solirubrobacteraceae bacterium]